MNKNQPINTLFAKQSKCLILVGLIFLSTIGFSQQQTEDLHKNYDILLQLYVNGTRFDYDHLYKNTKDLERLSNYIDRLEATDPKALAPKDALAFWINLYNAATLELVLKNYPVKSIKDIGGMFSSPWKQKVVTVTGYGEITLNAIENEIIRKEFNDARIHFALNCASIGCPPLSKRAYLGSTLDAQLDNASKNALKNELWLKITDSEIYVSKILDWYKEDFIAHSGGVREYLAKYYPAQKKAIMDENRKIKTMDYNWKLNRLVY